MSNLHSPRFDTRPEATATGVTRRAAVAGLSAALSLATGAGRSGTAAPSPPSLLEPMLANTRGRAEIYHVTTLAGDGSGSLAHAVRTGSPDVTRIVVFDVAGECVMGADKHDIQGRLVVNRPNIWIAGQTAPVSGPSGRGYTLRGRLAVRRGHHVVVEHLRIRPVIGRALGPLHRPPDGRGLLIVPPAPAEPGITGQGFVLLRNLSVQWTQDVIGAAMAGSNRRRHPDGGLCFLKNYAVDNCLFAEPLSRTIALREGPYHRGHSYGWNCGEGSYRGLLRGNLTASAIWRTPQTTQLSSGLLVNNYTFNFGFSRGGTPYRYWPMTQAPKTPENGYFHRFWQPGDPHLDMVWGALNNVGEAGNRTDFPATTHPHYGNPVMLDDVAAVGAIRWHEAGNRFLSYYDMSRLAGKGWNDENPALAAAPYHDIALIPPSPANSYDGRIPSYTRLAAPPFGPTSTLLPAAAVWAHVARHAGAWPAARDATDARIVREVAAKTHAAVGASLATDAPVEPRLAAPPRVPHDPGDRFTFDRNHPLLRPEANGRTVLENWLHRTHIAAGGADIHDAAEWLNRPEA